MAGLAPANPRLAIRDGAWGTAWLWGESEAVRFCATYSAPSASGRVAASSQAAAAGSSSGANWR